LGADSYSNSSISVPQITLGNMDPTTELRCGTTTILGPSDARDKTDIEDLNVGIELLTKLKPSVYRWDRREWYDGGIRDHSKKSDKKYTGFIAQELEELENSLDVKYLNLVHNSNPEKLEIGAGNLIPPIVKSIQQLVTKVEQLEEENKSMKSLIESILKNIEK
jgi:hypothetical protein